MIGEFEAVVLATLGKSMDCRRLGSGEKISFRSDGGDVVPGEIIRIVPEREWTYRRAPRFSGSISGVRLDVKALGLMPLRLEEMEEWDPKDEYWGEPGERLPRWARQIIRRGKRPQFEMERVLPGEDPADMESDPIIEAIDLKDAGDKAGAYRILMDLCRADLRSLDAHAHLGLLAFHRRPELALRHYEVGVRIGELSMPADRDGVLPWGWVDNRPFLRCLHGYALCLWRVRRMEEAAAALERLLWLNPGDNQGARFLIEDVRQGHRWETSGGGGGT